jgi:dTDP-4-amino-4,6-dideoxygalactose transaminase
MGILREIPPTAGWQLWAQELWLSLQQKETRLSQEFAEWLNLPYAATSCSGTAAFYFILETLKKISSRKGIVIPAFACPLLPLAIARAGLKTIVCDINQDNFNFDKAALEETCQQNQDILAIVAVHLAGIPLELERLQETSRRHHLLLIEDCAQSLGVLYRGNKTGSLGDFSFFSLCRGKGLTIYEGGIAATTRKEYAPLLSETIQALSQNKYLSEALKILELLGYWLLYRPGGFWFVWRLPQIFWQLQAMPLRSAAEYFSPNFPTHKLSAFRERLAQTLFGRLEEEIGGQRKKAEYYLENLQDVSGLKIISEPPDTRASYPFLTLVFDSARRKKTTLHKLSVSGLGAGEIYSQPLNGYDYLRPIVEDKIYPHAHYLASNSLTLSTSCFLRQAELERIVKIIRCI